MAKVKCSECGFLAMWSPYQRNFEEAPELFRTKGTPQSPAASDASHQPKCFVRKADLLGEIKKSSDGYTTAFRQDEANLKVISKERCCDAYIEWRQGFHPTDHQEMLDRQSLLQHQESQNRWSQGIALGAVVVAVLGSGTSAYFNMEASKLEAKAQLEAAKLQIESQKELNKQQPPINITIQMPRQKTKAAVTKQ